MNNILLAYALNAENKLVHIDSVKNGLECGCVCPGCQEPLVARNAGEIREHHFAHEGGSGCKTGYQTMIHLLAKEIILEKGIFPIIASSGYLRPCEVYAEKPMPKYGIIPDIFGYVPLTDGPKVIGKIPVIIEIRVTHKVDQEKKNKIVKAGIPSVEVDLSKFCFTDKNALCNAIYNPENWVVINTSIGRQYLSGVRFPARTVLTINRYGPMRRRINRFQ